MEEEGGADLLFFSLTGWLLHGGQSEKSGLRMGGGGLKETGMSDLGQKQVLHKGPLKEKWNNWNCESSKTISAELQSKNRNSKLCIIWLL